MKRRDFITTLQWSLLGGMILPNLSERGFLKTTKEGYILFFDNVEIPRIRANASHPLLRPTFEAWQQYQTHELLEIINKPLQTGNLITDFGAMLTRTQEVTLLALVTQESRYKEILMESVRVLLEMPRWDNFLEQGKVIGIMRASKAVTCLTFILEVLGDEISDTTKKEIYTDIATKGVEPCAFTIWCYDHPEQVTGWYVDDLHKPIYPYDMKRWPYILANINLRAVPTMGLGLGALALTGKHPNAPAWLDLALDSTKKFLNLFKPDGSYFEGLSYVDYAFRTLFLFMNAYDRNIGGIDWNQFVNFEGVSEYIACMQLGKKPDNSPDIVNISDANFTVTNAVPSWIAKYTKDPLAQYNATHHSRVGYFADFLWFDEKRKEKPPSAKLLNKKFELDWLVCRTGWEDDDAILAFRSGDPVNHEHADRNHLTFKFNGERLLTDHFGASYDYRLPHWLLRQTEAHNCVLVDGKGHHYVDGSEGTNAGNAHAKILSYIDRGDYVSWVSDATQGYALLNNPISLVRRSVLYKKPDLVLIYDQLTLRDTKGEFEQRFFPDNRDMMATLKVFDQNGFVIQRPSANLIGKCFSNSPITVEDDTLELPSEYGIFPYITVRSNPSESVELLTILKASAWTNEQSLQVHCQKNQRGWQINVVGNQIFLDTTTKLPKFYFE